MSHLDTAVWRKSSNSNGNGVEVAFVDDMTYLRDSRKTEGPVLAFTAPEWQAFVGGVHDGEFGSA